MTQPYIIELPSACNLRLGYELPNDVIAWLTSNTGPFTTVTQKIRTTVGGHSMQYRVWPSRDTFVTDILGKWLAATWPIQVSDDKLFAKHYLTGNGWDYLFYRYWVRRCADFVPTQAKIIHRIAFDSPVLSVQFKLAFT